MTKIQGGIELVRPSGQMFSADTALAAAYGTNAAFLIHHFQHWIRINKTRKQNFKDGRTWTYQTYNEIADHFPFLTRKMVRTAIDNLIEYGVIVKGNYNKMPGDNTCWFAFTDESIYVPDLVKTKVKDESPPEIPPELPSAQKVTPPLPKRADPCPNGQTPAQTGRAIPDTKPDAKQDISYKTTNQYACDSGSVGGFPKDLEKKQELYACLKQIDIPDQDKISFMNRFSEKIVSDSVKHCTKPCFKIKDSLEKSIAYFCLHPEHIVPSKEEIAAQKQKEKDAKADRAMERRHWAAEIRKSLWSHCRDVLGNVHACPNDGIDRLTFSNDRKTEAVYYTNDNFRNLVEHYLRKFSFPIPDFLVRIP